MSTYSTLVAIVFVLITCFVDADAGSTVTFAVARKSVVDVITQLRRERQIFLAPINIYAGVSIAFILLDYAQVTASFYIFRLL